MFSFLLYFALKFLKANIVDPDQMPQNVASDQGQQCLHLYWVCTFFIIPQKGCLV